MVAWKFRSRALPSWRSQIKFPSELHYANSVPQSSRSIWPVIICPQQLSDILQSACVSMLNKINYVKFFYLNYLFSVCLSLVYFKLYLWPGWSDVLHEILEPSDLYRTTLRVDVYSLYKAIWILITYIPSAMVVTIIREEDAVTPFRT